MGSMFRIVKNTVQPEPTRKIIKAGEYSDMVQAQDILAEATKRAEEIMAEARMEYVREKERGYQDGLIEAKMEMAERMIDHVTSSVDYLERMEITIVDIVMQSLRKLIDGMDDEERITKIVHKSVSYFRGQKKVIIRVSPEEYNTVRDKILDYRRDYPGIDFLDVVSDARLDKGGCTLESDIGVIDAGLDTQLAGIEKAFLKHLSKDKS